MQRAAMWLNIYGCQAVQCKLKKVLKTQQMHFYVIQPDDHIDFFCFICIQISHISQCLNLLLVGSKKVWIPQKWCLTTYIDSLGYSIFKFYIGTYFGTYFSPILGSEGKKNGQKFKIVHFLLFFVLKIFLHTIFSNFFFWMATI